MFVVSGEALFDVFAGEPSASGLALDGRMGGSPFNVAVGLARLGQPAAFFGAVSRDAFGNRLLARLVEENVHAESVRRTDAPTTLSIVGLDERGVPSYTFHGGHGADRDLPVSSLAAIPAQARAFHFGSYSMLVEPAASTLRALAESQRDRRLVAYDPNVRLNVEPSPDRWREILAWMTTRTHVLKVSEEDLGLALSGRCRRRAGGHLAERRPSRWSSSRAAARAPSPGPRSIASRARAGKSTSSIRSAPAIPSTRRC